MCVSVCPSARAEEKTHRTVKGFHAFYLVAIILVVRIRRYVYVLAILYLIKVVDVIRKGIAFPKLDFLKKLWERAIKISLYLHCCKLLFNDRHTLG